MRILSLRNRHISLPAIVIGSLLISISQFNLGLNPNGYHFPSDRVYETWILLDGIAILVYGIVGPDAAGIFARIFKDYYFVSIPIMLLAALVASFSHFAIGVESYQVGSRCYVSEPCPFLHWWYNTLLIQGPIILATTFWIISGFVGIKRSIEAKV